MNRKVGFALVFTVATLFAIVWNAKAQSEIHPPQEKWEYKIVHLATLAGIESVGEAMTKAFDEKGVWARFEAAEAFNTEIAGRMNELGKEGWDLVCFQKDTGFVFKRKK